MGNEKWEFVFHKLTIRWWKDKSNEGEVSISILIIHDDEQQPWGFEWKKNAEMVDKY